MIIPPAIILSCYSRCCCTSGMSGGYCLSCHLKAELLVHSHEIEVVPGLTNFTVFQDNIGHPGKLYLLPVGSCCIDNTTCSFMTLLDNDVLHVYVDLWKLVPET